MLTDSFWFPIQVTGLQITITSFNNVSKNIFPHFSHFHAYSLFVIYEYNLQNEPLVFYHHNISMTGQVTSLQ